MTTPRSDLIRAAIAAEQPPVADESVERASATPNRWVPSPAVRTWLYSIIAAGVPLLVLLGVFTPDVGGHVLNIAAAFLAIGGLSLAARNTPKD